MGMFPRGAVVVVVLGVVAVCLSEKHVNDPTLSLRPPGSSSPVFSSSIDSIPVSSASSNQASVYAKRPNTVHSTASASSSVGSSVSTSDQSGTGGRNTQPWFAQGVSYDFEGNNAGSASHSSASASTGSGYYEQPPSPSAPTPTDSYGTSVPNPQGPSYTYYYQHYPSASNQGAGWSGGESGGHGGLFGDLSLPGLQFPGLHGGGEGGLAGLGGVGGVKAIAKVIAKGILLVKPFLLLGLLALIAIPVLLLLVPLPIVTISGQPSSFRSARSSQLATYLTQLSGKVLNAEECLERIICKLPHAPEKYQTKAKLIWDEYGNKMVSNERVSRGLNAYFETSSQKNKNLKCNQRFKCSNKYL